MFKSLFTLLFQQYSQIDQHYLEGNATTTFKTFNFGMQRSRM